LIEGRIWVKGRRGRRRKHLLDYFKEKRRYWKLKGKSFIAQFGELDLEEAIDPS
jgi:hypothetical protein